jgi:hypothetical protein
MKASHHSQLRCAFWNYLKHSPPSCLVPLLPSDFTSNPFSSSFFSHVQVSRQYLASVSNRYVVRAAVLKLTWRQMSHERHSCRFTKTDDGVNKIRCFFLLHFSLVNFRIYFRNAVTNHWDCGLVDCDNVKSYRRISKFRWKVLHLSSWFEGKEFIK